MEESPCPIEMSLPQQKGSDLEHFLCILRQEGFTDGHVNCCVEREVDCELVLHVKTWRSVNSRPSQSSSMTVIGRWVGLDEPWTVLCSEADVLTEDSSPVGLANHCQCEVSTPQISKLQSTNSSDYQPILYQKHKQLFISWEWDQSGRPRFCLQKG